MLFGHQKKPENRLNCVGLIALATRLSTRFKTFEAALCRIIGRVRLANKKQSNSNVFNFLSNLWFVGKPELQAAFARRQGFKPLF